MNGSQSLENQKRSLLRIALREGCFCKLLPKNNLREAVFKKDAMAKLLKIKAPKSDIIDAYIDMHFIINYAYRASNLSGAI